MIALERKRAIVHRSFAGQDRIDLNQELMERRASGEPARRAVWEKARRALSSESAGKCAYCESDVKTTSHGSVDHYRPQTKYWWLAYCYDNFVFSCGICNSDYKKDFFPVSGRPMASGDNAERLTPDGVKEQAGMPWSVFAGQHKRESPHLPDPYLDDPEAYLAWKEEGEQVLLVAGDRSERAGWAASALEVCGVNREDVARRRFVVLQVMKTILRMIAVDPDEGMRTRFRAGLLRMAEPSQPYAGMARFYLRSWGLI